MRSFVFLILVLALAAPVAAQTAGQPQATTVNSAILILPAVAGDGDAITCHDFRNRIVNFVDIEGLGDAGRAEFIWGSGPVVMTDPDIVRDFPVSLRMFFKLHECGHHALGHLLAPTNRSEREADCWAIEQGHMLAAINRIEIDSWRPFFSRSHGDRYGHMPGPQRVDFMLSCYDDGPGIMAKLE